MAFERTYKEKNHIREELSIPTYLGELPCHTKETSINSTLFFWPNGETMTRFLISKNEYWENKEGDNHRLDGPAIIGYARCQYWIDGNELTREQFKMRYEIVYLQPYTGI